MGVLSKVRGLWRFDGDEEPVTVSRRRFIFLTGVAVAGSFLPERENRVLATMPASPGTVTELPVYDAVTGDRTGVMLYVADVNHTTGIVILDTIPPPQYGFPYHHGLPDDKTWMGLPRSRVPTREEVKAFPDLRPGDVLTPRDVLRLQAWDETRYTKDDRYIVWSARSQPGIVEAIEISKRRLLRKFPERDRQRPGGKVRS